MAGFALTAVAVAPMAPDAALLPKRLVSETIAPEGLDEQVAALASQQVTLTRSELTRGTDTIDSLLGRLGVSDPAAAAFLRRDAKSRALLAGRSGKMVQVHADTDGALEDLVARFPLSDPDLARTHFNRLTVHRVQGRWTAQLEVAPLEAQTRLASGTIRSSLFAATDESGLPDAVASQLADIFGTDIDFHRELRRGDTFSLIYETLTADGEPVTWNDGAGRVLAAEFVNGGKSYQAIWFTPPGGRGGYYDAAGNSKQRAFLTSPVAFSRVSSGFAVRFHPILKQWKKHDGVDYAAAMGTPVRTIGEGTVEFAGQQNGYGNVIKIRHGNQKETLYAHLSRIDVKRGQHVEQGQRIGAVGMTGWATGPHLHFEFISHGQHVDPLQVARAAEIVPLNASARPRFKAVAQGAEEELHLAASLPSLSRRAE